MNTLKNQAGIIDGKKALCYTDENDGKFYYFHIWNWKLKSFTVMIGLKGLKEKSICESKLKYIENKYRSLV